MIPHLSSRTITFNIIKCVAAFYTSYYIVGSICFAAFSLENFDGKIPFDFIQWVDFENCCANVTNLIKVNVVSQLVNFSLCGIIFSVLIQLWTWDYCITVTLIHITICCLVNLCFPLNWSWWVCLGTSLLLMILLSESLSFIWRKKKAIRIQPEEGAYKNGSFLIRD